MATFHLLVVSLPVPQSCSGREHSLPTERVDLDKVDLLLRPDEVNDVWVYVDTILDGGIMYGMSSSRL